MCAHCGVASAFPVGVLPHASVAHLGAVFGAVFGTICRAELRAIPTTRMDEFKSETIHFIQELQNVELLTVWRVLGAILWTISCALLRAVFRGAFDGVRVTNSTADGWDGMAFSW